MSDETKAPQAGEYWFPARGKPFLCIAANDRGDTVWQDWVDTYYLYGDDCIWKHWRHEPRCTGFDWTEPPAIDPGDGWELLPKRVLLIEGDQVLQTTGDWIDTNFVGDEANDACVYRRRKPPAETWPKWYVCDTWVSHAYITRDSAGRLTSYFFDGRRDCHTRDWDETDDMNVVNQSFREVTEAEALARVKPAEPIDPATKVLHELAGDAGIDPLGLYPADIAEKLIAKQQVTGCQVESPDRVPENRPARDVVMEIVKLLADSSMTDEESADRAFRIGNQWLDDNPEDPPPFAKPFTDPRSGMGIKKEPAHELCQMCGEPAIPGTGGCRECTQYAIEATQSATPAPIEQERWFMWSDDRCPIAFVKRAGGKVFNLNVDGMFKTSDDWCARYEEHLINGEMIEVTEASAKAYLRRPRRKIIEAPAPQPKRTPVRLFVSADVRWGDRYIVSVKDGNPNPERHQEIKFDGSGFYVEGGE